MLALLLPILMQVGPAPSEAPISPLPPELRDRPPRIAPAATPEADPVRSPAAIDVCLATAKADPAKARELAEAWAAKAKGESLAAAEHCLGVAASGDADWSGARIAFLAARDAVSERAYRARMGALAGSAALADDDPAAALPILETAAVDAAGDAALSGSIALDRASALVALGRNAEAATALAEARGAMPDDAQAWLLSATLSRRMGNLSAAQGQIQEAARLLPVSPDIGLEAGVIAVLSGRDDAARKSWQSVIDAAPDSVQATTARGYLKQLDAGGEAQIQDGDGG
jgi:tetratricopeptide (TPR) repeat protein